MKNKFLYYVLVMLVAAGAFSGLISSYKKAAVESRNDRVELVMDFSDISKISVREGVATDTVLKKFKDAGLTSLSLTENTLEKLQIQGEIVWLTGYETSILEKIKSPENKKNDDTTKKLPERPIKRLNPAIRSLIRSGLYDPRYSYIIGNNRNSLEFAKQGLSLMLGRTRVIPVKHDTLLVMDDEEDLLSLGIGIQKKDIIPLINKGFFVIPRLKNNYRLNGDILSKKLDILLSHGPFDKIIFDGEEVGGYKNRLPGIASALKESGIAYGYIEMAGQKGDAELLALTGRDTVRVHSISEDEMQKKMTKNEAVDRFERAFYERGVRVLFIRPFYSPQNGSGLIDTNAAYIKDIKDRLELSGFSAGEAKSVPALKTSSFSLMLLSLGLAAALCMTAGYFINMRPWQIISLLAASAILFLMFQAAGDIGLLRKLCALSAAVIFPVLSIASVFDIKKGPGTVTLSRAISMVMTTFFITVIGALYITGALADTSFMTGAKQFMGVKIAFILPLLGTALYLAINSEQFNSREKLLSILNRPLTVGMILALALIGGAGAIYILRSGNFGIGVLDMERVARSLLENLMSVRPRTKEFLIGYPALLLAAIYSVRRHGAAFWALLVIGTIGPVSTVNTFCHAHSPFMVSVLRSFYGVLIGIFVGMVYYSLYNFGRAVIKK